MKTGIRIGAGLAFALAAMALLMQPAVAQAAPNDTVKAVVAKGAVFDMMGQGYVFAAGADGSYSDAEGKTAGKYRVDGALLCVTPSVYPQERCFTFPAGKASGDSFDVQSDGGAVKVTIR